MTREQKLFEAARAVCEAEAICINARESVTDQRIAVNAMHELRKVVAEYENGGMKQ